MNKCDLYWLAGILEGEGSFLAGPPSSPNIPVIALQMTDEDIVAKVSRLFNVKYHECNRDNPNYKTIYSFHLRGKRAVEVMKNIKNIMGKRRQKQIEKAIECYNAKYYRLDSDTVKKIKFELTKGYTQGKVAKKFGIRRETVNKIHRGKIWNFVKI